MKAPIHAFACNKHKIRYNKAVTDCYLEGMQPAPLNEVKFLNRKHSQAMLEHKKGH